MGHNVQVQAAARSTYSATLKVAAVPPSHPEGDNEGTEVSKGGRGRSICRVCYLVPLGWTDELIIDYPQLPARNDTAIKWSRLIRCFSCSSTSGPRRLTCFTCGGYLSELASRDVWSLGSCVYIDRAQNVTNTSLNVCRLAEFELQNRSSTGSNTMSALKRDLIY
jgi:hypothetical protein